jgi:hypothetical protein
MAWILNLETGEMTCSCHQLSVDDCPDAARLRDRIVTLFMEEEFDADD